MKLAGKELMENKEGWDKSSKLVPKWVVSYRVIKLAFGVTLLTR